jgi:hypothetical protein
MRRIDERTVELTDEREERAKQQFEGMLDRGFGIAEAAKLAVNRGDTMLPASILDDEFVTWLSEGTVTRWGSRYRIRMSARGLRPLTIGTLRPLSDQLTATADQLQRHAESREQWHAVEQLRSAARCLFDAAGALDIHDRKH